MPLLLAPFPQFDPLALAQITRQGIGDLRKELDTRHAMAQDSANTALKFQAQTLGDIQDSLWKQREADRRAQADHFNMQIELGKLHMREQEMAYKDKHAFDKYDPAINPELPLKLEAQQSLIDQRKANTLTPDEKATKDAKAKADLSKAESAAAEAERTLQYGNAVSDNVGATELLKSINATDAEKMPMTPESSALMKNAEDLQASSALDLKRFAPIPKPGTVQQPKPPKPPTVTEKKFDMSLEFGDVDARLANMEKEIDRATREHASVVKRISAIEADPVQKALSKKELADLKAQEKELSEFQSRDIDGKPISVPIGKAEQHLSDQKAEAARRKKLYMQDQPANTTLKTSATPAIQASVPLPKGQPVVTPVSPLLPTLQTIGLDKAQQDLLQKMLTP